MDLHQEPHGRTPAILDSGFVPPVNEPRCLQKSARPAFRTAAAS